MSAAILSSPAASPLRPAADGATAAAASALELQAALLSHEQLADAATSWTRAIAGQFHFERVSLGLKVGNELRVIALSNGLPTAHGTPEVDRLTQVFAESLDQQASILYPETRPQAHPRITLAHSRLRGDGAGSVASVPLVAAGRVIGVVTVERAASAISAAELDAIEHVVCLAGPVLNLMRLNQRRLGERARDALHELRAANTSQRSRWVAGAALALLAALAVLPVAWHIGGHARLEGAVQRVLVAPADGFLRQVHARPGDTVRAGQVLVELAEQDLQLEQQRWQSQLAQHENAYAAANAHADRAQQVIQQSRAAEAEAQLALVQMKLDRGRIEAPFDGMVVQGDLSQSLGAPLAQGAELMTIAPLGRFRVIVEVDERDIGEVAVGQGGSLALSALPWNTLPIRVLRITPMATPLEGRNVFEVEAELLAQSNELRPGLQGSAHIEVGHRPWLFSATRRLVDGLRLGVWEWLG